MDHSVHFDRSTTGSTYEDFVFHMVATISFVNGAVETVRREYRIADFPKYSKQTDSWIYRSTTDPSAVFDFTVTIQYFDGDAGVALCRPWVDAMTMVSG